MISCRRLGYAVLSVADLEREIAHYQEVVGLFLSSKERDRAVFVGPTGEECLVLVREDDPPQLKGLSFEVLPSTDLAEINARLKRSGIASEVSQGSTPLIDKVVRFPDPLGRTIELFTHRGFFSDPVEVRGIAPIKLGHVASFVTDLGSITEFYTSQLGFRRSDWVEGRSMFLRCSPDHHTVNFFRRDTAGLGHIAFEVKDYAELGRASDILAQNKFFLDWGPARHHIGHNIACYHSSPGGVRIEFYAEMDLMKDEDLGYYDPRPWHEDRPQRPKEWRVGTGRNKWIPDAP